MSDVPMGDAPADASDGSPRSPAADGIRVLKRHLEAVERVLRDLEPGEDAAAIAARIASAVLTAYDDQMRYVVVTSDYVVFGPYASRESARKAIDAGLCANRAGTFAMVLPMKPVPRGGRTRVSAGRDTGPDR